jgi:hypothetical protein
MRHSTQLRHEVAIVQRYLASLRTPAGDDRTHRFSRRAPADTAAAVARAAAAETAAAPRAARRPEAA